MFKHYSDISDEGKIGQMGGKPTDRMRITTSSERLNCTAITQESMEKGRASFRRAFGQNN
jgi:hypothetical protein